MLSTDTKKSRDTLPLIFYSFSLSDNTVLHNNPIFIYFIVLHSIQPNFFRRPSEYRTYILADAEIEPGTDGCRNSTGILVA